MNNNEEKIVDILDGAVGEYSRIASELEDQKRIAADSTRDIEERIEAFEDIIDSQVGDTPLVRTRNLEREFGFRQLFLKFEGGNPSGTQKDRIAFAQAMDGLRRGYDAITLATCGNYGVACAFAASLAGLRCLVFLPENFHTKRLKEMEELGAEIIRTPGDYEQAVVTSQGACIQRDNPGRDIQGIFKSLPQG
ncbi:MAG: pyridoxal-phosphate dependent enzyme [Calditrichaceae bacterium]